MGFNQVVPCTALCILIIMYIDNYNTDLCMLIQNKRFAASIEALSERFWELNSLFLSVCLCLCCFFFMNVFSSMVCPLTLLPVSVRPLC